MDNDFRKKFEAMTEADWVRGLKKDDNRENVIGLISSAAGLDYDKVSHNFELIDTPALKDNSVMFQSDEGLFIISINKNRPE